MQDIAGKKLHAGNVNEAEFDSTIRFKLKAIRDSLKFETGEDNFEAMRQLKSAEELILN